MVHVLTCTCYHQRYLCPGSGAAFPCKSGENIRTTLHMKSTTIRCLGNHPGLCGWEMYAVVRNQLAWPLACTNRLRWQWWQTFFTGLGQAARPVEEGLSTKHVPTAIEMNPRKRVGWNFRPTTPFPQNPVSKSALLGALIGYNLFRVKSGIITTR